MFSNYPSLKEKVQIAEGTTTGDVDTFLKMWHEIPTNTIGFNFSNSVSASSSGMKWFPYNKGGEYRRWYGNRTFLVNWENNGSFLKGYKGSYIRGEKFYFLPGITWSKVSSGLLSFRFFEEGFLFDTGGLCLFTDENPYYLAMLNSKASSGIMKLLAPTLNFTVGTVSSIPVISELPNVATISLKLIGISKHDWNDYETSWDFTTSPLFDDMNQKPALADTYKAARNYWQKILYGYCP